MHHPKRRRVVNALLLIGLIVTMLVQPVRADEIADIKQTLETLRRDYEARISALEMRLAAAEGTVAQARKSASAAVEIAEDAAISATSGSSAPNTFNPAIGAVLVGVNGDIDRSWQAVPGFMPGGEIGPGDSGFSLGESEVNLKASIDDQFFANLTLAIEDDEGETEIAVEEAWVETTALPLGISTRIGRQFSGIGYLNSFHRHSDDFVDRPLPYQAFLGGQYIADGIQARWVAPTDFFLEMGAEIDWGSRFPASGSEDTAPQAWSAFAHVGADAGDNHSWQTGVSYLSVDAETRGVATEDPASPSFSGDSDVITVDFVWKWAPYGNPAQTNFKVQGEFFKREEQGSFAGLPYDGDQSGWYLQAVWQFMPSWRVGYRRDETDTDNGALFDGTLLADVDSVASRDSFMIDWSHSEFSRIRFQYVYDNVLSQSSNHFYLQYLMSIGAHGAHRF